MTYDKGSWGTYTWDPNKTREENLLSAESLGAAVTKGKMDNIEDGIANAHIKNRELEQAKADKIALQNLDEKKADNDRVDSLEQEKADITFVESMAEGQVNNIDFDNARNEDKAYVDNEIDQLDKKKADNDRVDSLEQVKADNDRVDSLEQEKADITFVESVAEGKVSNVDFTNARKDDKNYVDNEIDQLDKKKADKDKLEEDIGIVTAQLAKTEDKIDDSTFYNAIDLVHSWQTNKPQTTTPVYIEVGDSLRASNGAHTFEQIHDYLMGYGVITHMIATSGLKAEHFSKTTPDLQQGLHTLDSVLELITNNGFNTVVNIALGMNDVSKTATEIESYLQKIVDDILSVKPQTKFIFTSPQKTENGYTYDKLNEAYRNIVSKNAVSFIDVGSNVFKQFTPTVKSLYFLDSTHPNEQGQLKIGQYIVSKLRAENAREPYTTQTPNIPENYYVRVARFVLKQQWMGVTGRLKITQLGSAWYQANSTYVDIFTYLREPLPSVDTTNVVYDFANVNSDQPDILTSNFFIRPTVMTNKMTIVDVFIKNRINTNRRFKVSFDGELTGVIGTADIIVGSSLPLENMPGLVSGGSDATLKIKDNLVLSSEDGSKWQLKVDNTGDITTTKIFW